MTDQQGATPADTQPSATDSTGDDDQAQALLADAVASTGDEPLGEGGLKALQAERDARKELEKQIAELSGFKSRLAEALGVEPGKNDKSDLDQITERLSKHEQQLGDERAARWRAEIAHEHGFTAEQASELRGGTREELAAHAERLKALFPPATPGIPKPDPSQGGRNGAGIDLDSRIDEARKKGDFKTVIALENQKLK